MAIQSAVTARQFFNNVFCLMMERCHRVRALLSAIALFIFPAITRRTLVQTGLSTKRYFRQSCFIYIYVWFFAFFVQGAWAFVRGRFWPDQDPSTKQFLEDKANLINYLIIAELYFIVGYLFLSHIYSIANNLRRSGLAEALGSSNGLCLGKARDTMYFGLFIVVLATLLAGSYYAAETATYTSRYWFMTTDPQSRFSAAGYYYLLVNCFALFFILWVTAAHFSLFILAGTIAKNLRMIYLDGTVDDRKKWDNLDQLKEWFAPFTSTLLLSKAFVLVVAVNLLTWKLNEPDGSLMYSMAVVFSACFGVWVFSLPRYFIQMHIFRIWKRSEKQMYGDIRLPMVVGASALLDFFLLALVFKVLLGDTISAFIESLFS